MTDLTTLSTLLGSQEARDAAPCVPAIRGQWYLLRRNGMHQLDFDKDDGWAWKADGSHFATTELDCIWSGDLPALLAALVAERDGLAAKLDEIERYDYDWTQSGPENLVAVQYIATKAMKEQQP